jgi:hypothetical protein
VAVADQHIGRDARHRHLAAFDVARVEAAVGRVQPGVERGFGMKGADRQAEAIQRGRRLGEGWGRHHEARPGQHGEGA